ncbi:MAG TPA: hypothetical protein VKU01_23580 [Bryobacteraceae bacterium]|nr:hypothetical protein [Bryobacteraceae bacterium]
MPRRLSWKETAEAFRTSWDKVSTRLNIFQPFDEVRAGESRVMASEGRTPVLKKPRENLKQEQWQAA